MPKAIRLVGRVHFLACALLATALAPAAAWAALGEVESTVHVDAHQLQGVIKSTARTDYRVHEIQLPSGTVLREFATAGGKVFAVTWSGPSIPDLKQILGRYFDVYVAAAQERSGRRHHVDIQAGELVFQSTGHMRAFAGRAYLPAAVPAGISLEELH